MLSMAGVKRSMIATVLCVSACASLLIMADGCSREQQESATPPISQYVGAAIFQVRNPAAVSREQLLGEVQAVVDSATGTYGVYVYETDTGESFGINQDVAFEGASTIKIPILMLLYAGIDAGTVSGEETMVYQWGDYEDGTGSIQQEPVGTEWTIRELAEKMMQESDNIAKNMLFRRLGLYAVEEYAIANGADDFDLIYNRVTPRDMGALLKAILEYEVAGPELTGDMLGLMTGTDHELRIPRYLDGVMVAHKIGTLGDSVNDAGIIFAGDSPFVLCVYSEGVASEVEAEEVIGRIAWLVTNYEVLKKYHL